MLYLFSQSYSNQKLMLNDVVSLHNQFITNILTKRKNSQVCLHWHMVIKKKVITVFLFKNQNKCSTVALKS